MNISFLNIGKVFSNKKKQEEKEVKKAYTSIKTLPIAIWWDITNGGDYKQLVLEGEYTDSELYIIYLELFQEYLDEFGMSEKREAFIKAKLNYARKLAQWISTQASFDKMMLEMAEIDLKEVTPNESSEGKGQSLGEAIAIIEHEFNFHIDENTLSTYKFYNYQRILQNKVEQQKALANKWQRK